MSKKTFSELLGESLTCTNGTQWHQLDPSLQATARIEWAVVASVREMLSFEYSARISSADNLAIILSQDPTTFYLKAGLRAFPEDSPSRPISWQSLLENPEPLPNLKIQQELLGINVLFTARLPETHCLWPVFNAHHDFYTAQLAEIRQQPPGNIV